MPWMHAKGKMGIYEYEPPAALNQAAPVNGTYYDILPVTPNARIYGVAVNVEDANEMLQVQITIDGETMVTSLAATHSTTYFIHMVLDAITRTDGLIMSVANPQQFRAFMVEGRSVQVEVRKTTAAGAGNLTGVVAYGVIRDAV